MSDNLTLDNTNVNQRILREYLNQKRDELLNEKNKQELKSHPMIQEAEKLFNSKVDKVILN